MEQMDLGVAVVVAPILETARLQVHRAEMADPHITLEVLHILVEAGEEYLDLHQLHS
jgi:hypothetical protein